MIDLQKVYEECVQECKDAEIPIRDDKVLSISTIKESNIHCYGICIMNKQNTTFEIFINPLFLKGNCPIKELKETIVHKLIHTCNRCFSYGKTWMKYAKIMNDKYGYELTTLADEDSIFHKDKPILHHYVCVDCGSLYNERTLDDDLNNGAFIKCPFCNSYYRRID